jgi:hypothetical protein
MQVQIDSVWQSMSLNLAIIAVYPLLLIVTGAITCEELHRLRSVFRALPLKLQPRDAAP